MFQEWTRNVCNSLKISFSTTLNASRKEFLLNENQRHKLELAKKLGDLKHRISLVQANRKVGGVKKADFAVFARDRSVKVVLNNKVQELVFPTCLCNL